MFVSLQFKLELIKEDKEKLIKLMRKQSSAIRVAYNMLKELEKEKTKNPHAQIYQRLRQLFPELPTKYIDSAIYKAKQYPTDKPVVFGSKRLFEKLCKNHLTGKAREKLKKQWRELRQGTLISIGSKHEAVKGNLLLRFVELDGKLHLRITIGNREFIYAKVLREPSNSKDKWLTFMTMLLESWQTQSYFPYTVELKLRDGEVYGSVSFELPTPEVRYTKESGVIAIDTNASPIHLAIVEVSKTGELLSYQTISLHHLLGLSQNSKDHQEWILAHQIVDLAIQKNKAIAIENLKKLKKGVRGDGKAKLRKRLHQWNVKKFLQKLIRVAMLKGVEVIEVNPAYTSIIGMLKYAPQLNIDKDIAGAYVIGRRALGFKEDTPENYERLLKDKEYLEFALKRYEEREKELRELIEKESNEYKRNALKSELKVVENAKNLLVNLIQSLQSEPSSCEGADGRNPERGRVAKTTLQSAWQVLKVALLFPILGKVLPRDLSPLKPVLVEGAWDRVRGRLVPLEAGGTLPIRDF
ncbi:IS200/IS605 family accessory protein TnpB-related protein [Thermocrinis sp.]|jgi:IS605 OrfB family transposase|uniref:IS200/IS605 family accessory protein TnpB-related protein n=1 Tax=Thermocrinis sp. TaxID=2024383 RepID=UPI0026118936|nr:IS200/IS605 family accessory protein TnpB-related protein [Thermocrinis sp.]